uniref:Uncharacterized protein n=1 Tax=viral metagenome TaxID=1070528 RepID=A0A6C0JZQ3_9ZZZZ
MEHEPYIIKAVVNGLIASSIIWAFWVPVLIAIVGPLTNAMIKKFACDSAGMIPTITEVIPFIPVPKTASDTTIPQNIIRQSKFQFENENLTIFMFLAFTGFVCISFSLYIAYRLILAYNLNILNIVVFNATMALIIVMIEIVFFATVTTVYIPFSSKDLLEAIRNKFNADINSFY